jgi:hypothetical protein
MEDLKMTKFIISIAAVMFLSFPLFAEVSQTDAEKLADLNAKISQAETLLAKQTSPRMKEIIQGSIERLKDTKQDVERRLQQDKEKR